MEPGIPQKSNGIILMGRVTTDNGIPKKQIESLSLSCYRDNTPLSIARPPGAPVPGAGNKADNVNGSMDKIKQITHTVKAKYF